MQTPILWSHGMADRTVLFEAGQAGPPFLEQAGVTCEFKVTYARSSTVLSWIGTLLLKVILKSFVTRRLIPNLNIQ